MRNLATAVIMLMLSAAMASAQVPTWNYSTDAYNNSVASFPGIAQAWMASVRSVAGLTAAGTTQATATSLTYRGAGIAEFATVASGTGVSLDQGAPVGVTQIVVNDGANALLIYPPVGSSATINGGASFSLPAGGVAALTFVKSGVWLTNVGGGGGGGGGGSAIPATTSLLCGSGTLGSAAACPGLVGISAVGAVQYGHGANQALQGNDLGAAVGPARLDSSALLPWATVHKPIVTDGLNWASNSLTVAYGFVSNTAIQGIERGLNNGVAELDSGGLIPLAEMPASVQSVGLNFGWGGVPGATALRQQVLPFACTIPVNLSGLVGWSNTAFTASASFSVAYVHAGAQTGLNTLVFGAAGQTPSAGGSSAAHALAAGDILQVASPGTPDATGADIVISIPCARS